MRSAYRAALINFGNRQQGNPPRNYRIQPLTTQLGRDWARSDIGLFRRAYRIAIEAWTSEHGRRDGVVYKVDPVLQLMDESSFR